MSDDRLTLSLVNVSPVESRTLVIQGGSFGEHQIVAVTQEGVRTRVADSSFQVVLAPGSGTTLEIEQRRYVNKPGYEFPWTGEALAADAAAERAASQNRGAVAHRTPTSDPARIRLAETAGSVGNNRVSY